jgi:hypothetical protein
MLTVTGFRSELAEHGHRRFLSHLERGPEGGWRLHVFFVDETAIPLLERIADGRCGPGDPVAFSPKEFVVERLGLNAAPE